MKCSDQDKQNGFKEIRVAMLDGKFEIVRVSVEKPEKLAFLFVQKPTPVKAFIGEAIGQDEIFVEKIHPASFHEIFLTAMSLIGADDLICNAMKKVGEKLIKEAESEQE